MLDSLKQGVSKATFEADRMMRLNRTESTVKTLEAEHVSTIAQVGAEVFTLYKQAALPGIPILDAFLAEMVRREAELVAKRREVTSIREERFTPAVVSQVMLFGRVCAHCRIKLVAGARFCPECGRPSVDIEHPRAARACPNGHTTSSPVAVFCPQCGARIDEGDPGRDGSPEPAADRA